ncbi:hypothetical protein BKP37_08695 [Anaerobacillus alkalilacustris]|uniref:Lipoprotein n=1 Tax=Anaerobacillus alkalilacustris TaxID=393763 RepID=A0A1S2LQC7_9BACI|nr:hypothetical protein [Anaerobacillus alkalilacustris]OIJ14410.1 hypothetical protein BKP37_08695 [Anaerobacillus alkalilacustris]
MFKFFLKYKVSLVLVIFFVILTGCGTTDRMEFYDNTESTTLSEEVNSISLDSQEDKVRQAFGDPDSVREVENNNSKYLEYNDIEFQIVNDKVVRYFYTNNKFKTQKGIELGSSKENVIHAYGENYYEREDTGQKIIGYFDKTKKVNIEFGFSEYLDSVMVSKIVNNR